jgi:SAM-dependent methyltransferase
MTTTPERAWWIDLYDETFADLMLEGGDPAEVRRTVDFLVEAAGLQPGDPVMDQGCGTGRLLVPFAERGYRLHGVDLVEPYVGRARRALEATGRSGTVVVGDIHEAVAPEPVALAFTWWTCLGYDAQDDLNVQPMRRAFESLRPGGLYAVDFMNVASVLRGFRPLVVTEGRGAAAGIRLERHSRLDLARGVLCKRWQWCTGDGRERVVETEVRLYLPHELARLLRAAGFASVDFVGEVDGRPLGEDSPRCIALARRPS